MADDVAVLLRFAPTDDLEQDEELTRRLAGDARDLDVGEVRLERAAPHPDDPKSGLTPIEWVEIVVTAGPALVNVVRLAQDWAARSRRSVRVRIGEDELLLSSVSDSQQDRIIDEFFDRHRD